jgi:hypothetical protein
MGAISDTVWNAECNPAIQAMNHTSFKRVHPSIWNRKAATTKDTKYHEGIHLQVFPSCTFVSFVVECPSQRPVQQCLDGEALGHV